MPKRFAGMIDPNRPLTPDSPYLVVHEEEPDGRGGCVETTAIFLTASTCPIGCSMCDLHRYTLDVPTPPGAIPRQIQRVLANRPGSVWLKLYNSGNFFDPRSIPPSDDADIARLCGGFSRVIVENHPKFGSDRLRRFADLLPSPLEVAVGLETVQPRWLRRMGKQMSRDDFDRYARWLAGEGISLRVFLIAGVPGIDVQESIRWARLSVRHAIAQGARHVSLIPARPGHGWNGQASQLPRFSLDDLLRLQHQAMEDAQGRAAITLDLWDLETVVEDDLTEATATLEKLRTVNLTQQIKGVVA